MDERRVQSLIINKDIDLFKNVKPFSWGSRIPLVENTIWKLRPVCWIWSFPLGNCYTQALSGKRIRKFIYKHMFTIIFIYLPVYIEDHVFTLISPIPIQQNKIYSNFLPFHVCSSLLWEWETWLPLSLM